MRLTESSFICIFSTLLSLEYQSLPLTSYPISITGYTYLFVIMYILWFCFILEFISFFVIYVSIEC